jgi:hypothetical protein
MDASKARFLTKTAIDSDNFHVITNNTSVRTHPSFKTIEEVKYGYRGNEVMILPITNHSNDITMIVECRVILEADALNKDNRSRKNRSMDSNSDDSDHMDGVGSSTQGPAKGISIIKGGFNALDEFTFKILMEFVK